jgi:HK97 family phage portal protein
MGHCLGWGNGYAEILRDSWTGEPYGLNLLSPRPWDTWPERVNGRLIYKIQRGTKELLPENVIHIAGLSWDGLVGYSPVALAREAIGLALAAERFGASFYGNGSHASGWLKSPKKLSLEARRNLRESFEEQHRGTGNANRIGVLEDGLEFEKSSIDPEDAQFLLTRKFQVIEICRLYRVPPHKVMDYEHAHLANLEQSNTDYLMTSLFPWCLQIEQEFDLKLLTTQERDNGFAYAHNLRAFMRADSAARAAYWDLMARNGVVSPNQIAAEEGFDPIEGGDVHFCPLNMTVLANIGKPSNDTQKRSTNEAA